MGTTIYSCDFCQKKQTEDSPILEIHSIGKRDGQFICLYCLNQTQQHLKHDRLSQEFATT